MAVTVEGGEVSIAGVFTQSGQQALAFTVCGVDKDEFYT